MLAFSVFSFISAEAATLYFVYSEFSVVATVEMKDGLAYTYIISLYDFRLEPSSVCPVDTS